MSPGLTGELFLEPVTASLPGSRLSTPAARLGCRGGRTAQLSKQWLGTQELSDALYLGTQAGGVCCEARRVEGGGQSRLAASRGSALGWPGSAVVTQKAPNGPLCRQIAGRELRMQNSLPSGSASTTQDWSP
jgi:hypothetical protein